MTSEDEIIAWIEENATHRCERRRARMTPDACRRKQIHARAAELPDTSPCRDCPQAVPLSDEDYQDAAKLLKDRVRLLPKAEARRIVDEWGLSKYAEKRKRETQKLNLEFSVQDRRDRDKRRRERKAGADYDDCPKCGGRKAKRAKQCLACHKAEVAAKRGVAG